MFSIDFLFFFTVDQENYPLIFSYYLGDNGTILVFSKSFTFNFLFLNFQVT